MGVVEWTRTARGAILGQHHIYQIWKNLNLIYRGGGESWFLCIFGIDPPLLVMVMVLYRCWCLNSPRPLLRRLRPGHVASLNVWRVIPARPTPYSSAPSLALGVGAHVWGRVGSC